MISLLEILEQSEQRTVRLCVLHRSQRQLSQTNEVTGKDHLTKIDFQEQNVLSTTPCARTCYELDIFVTFSVLVFGPRRKILCVFRAALTFFPILSQLPLHEIWLLVFSFFSISCSAKPTFGLFLMLTFSQCTAQSAKNILIPRSNQHPISFALWQKH